MLHRLCRRDAEEGSAMLCSSRPFSHARFGNTPTQKFDKEKLEEETKKVEFESTLILFFEFSHSAVIESGKPPSSKISMGKEASSKNTVSNDKTPDKNGEKSSEKEVAPQSRMKYA